MYICIDFDGTIVDHRFPEIGPPAPGCAGVDGKIPGSWRKVDPFYDAFRWRKNMKTP